MKTKKLIALLLSLIMLVGLLPTMAFAEDKFEITLDVYKMNGVDTEDAEWNFSSNRAADIRYGAFKTSGVVTKINPETAEINNGDYLLVVAEFTGSESIAPKGFASSMINVAYDYSKVQPINVVISSASDSTKPLASDCKNAILGNSTANGGYSASGSDAPLNGTMRVQNYGLSATFSSDAGENAVGVNNTIRALGIFQFKVVDASSSISFQMLSEESTPAAPSRPSLVGFADNGIAMDTNKNYPLSQLIKSGQMTGLPSVRLGAASPLTSITFDIDKTTLEVDGTTGGTVAVSNVQPVPSDAILGSVAWSIAPTGKGVTINASTGAVTVGATAEDTTYTITATSGTATGTKTFAVTRAAGVAKTMTVTATDKTAVYGTAKDITPSITVKDQYGGTMTNPTVTMDTAAGFSFDGTKISVANNATVGKHTLTFKCGTASATLDITVGKANGPAAPSITAEDAATKGGNGKLKGTSTAMEYNTSATATTGWKACSDTETLVPAGTYYVRVAETATHKAGAVTTGLVVDQPGTSKAPVVTITGGGQIEEGASATLEATLTNASACTGTLTYKWYKDGVEMSGETGSSITVNKEGTYKVEVTHTLGANDPAKGEATATVSIKTKTVVTVTKKASVSVTAGTTLKVSDLVTVDPAAAANLVNGTVTVYEKVPGKAEVVGVACTCSHKDENPVPETGHDAGCPYVKAQAAVPVSYKVATELKANTEYFATYTVTAVDDNDTYKVNAVSAAAAPTVEADEANFVKVTVTAGGGGGGGVSGITVRYNVGEHGTLTGSATESVQRGKTPSKVPTVTAKDGYKFLGWSLDGTTVVDPTTVTITSATTFTALYTSVKNTYISGYPDGTFRPDAHVTRAEVASMLARLNKDFDSNKTYTGSANDVAANTWFANFVNFGMEKGIISGYTDGTFRPDADITRGEFASMMARYMGLSGTGSATFADTNGHWAADSIAVLADKGIVNGYPDGGFHPDAQLTRAEAVQMVNTALAVQALTGAAEVTPSDVASTHWAYTQIIAAMNTDIRDIIG